jgi:signal transduction histidine kinase
MEQKDALFRLRDSCLASLASGLRSPLEQSDREEELSDWLLRHNSNDAIAAALANTDVTFAELDAFAKHVSANELDVCLRWIATGCATHALARDIERTTSRIHQLVSSIKRFTYMDRAAVPEPVDVGQLLEDTMNVLASKARGKSITLRKEIDPDLPKVLGMGGELNQVWMNLIDNALDAAPNGGMVTVGAKREHAFLTVRIVDNGPGIPEHVRPKIFDPFFTTKPPGQGTGLGLDIVQRVVRAHRGELDVTCAPGRTEFRVGLPLGDGVRPANAS